MTYTYDTADRLASVTNKQGSTTLSSFAYTLNPNSNRTQVVDNAGTTTYGYDALQQLTSVTWPGSTTDTYTYDPNNNRTAKNATSYTYDAADQMTAAGATSYTYDNAGNQTGRGADTFSWDHENRMTAMSLQTSSYAYNGDGLRTSRTSNSVTTNYTWDLAAGLPVILYDGTYNYIYGRGLIGRVDASNNQLWYLPDGLGSTAGVRDASGNSVASYTYDVFGADTPAGSSDNYQRFTGEQKDSESGYYYLRARYYDPATGRFLGRDPLGGGFPYVVNNPTNLIDPTGLTHNGYWYGCQEYLGQNPDGSEDWAGCEWEPGPEHFLDHVRGTTCGYVSCYTSYVICDGIECWIEVEYAGPSPTDGCAGCGGGGGGGRAWSEPDSNQFLDCVGFGLDIGSAGLNVSKHPAAQIASGAMDVTGIIIDITQKDKIGVGLGVADAIGSRLPTTGWLGVATRVVLPIANISYGGYQCLL